VTPSHDDQLAAIWRTLEGPPEWLDHLAVSGPPVSLSAAYDVAGLASATVSAASLAAAEFLAARSGGPRRAVSVDRRSAVAAFASEALFTPVGWQRPPAWDPIAGNYRSATGWIRLHTNYAHHRRVVAELLKADDRESVAVAVGEWDAIALEDAIVSAGGCAAAMHDRGLWLSTPAGHATQAEPVVRVTSAPATSAPAPVLAGAVARPYDGVRVLDLTRVIAGPVCTRFLAAFGADVLRIDPPGFEEVAALVPDTTVGKRMAALDLRTQRGRRVFEGLVSSAHVLVTGLRPDALTRLGYDPFTLRALRPALIIAALNAYGWQGPWRDRRGFDSLVQMSCGIAAAGATALGRDGPVPLPVQALDHGTGYVLAAAVGRALTRLVAQGTASDIRASLIGTANLLIGAPARIDTSSPAASRSEFDLEDSSTWWGPARRVPAPGAIEGVAGGWRIDAGPTGRDEPRWSDTTDSA
jgi:hypothetical protein